MQTQYDRSSVPRASQLLHWLQEVNTPRFDADGVWIAPESAPSYRERQWHALIFLRGAPPHVELANRILANNPADGNDFQAHFAALLLRQHEDKLTPQVRAVLDSDLRAVSDHVDRHLFRYTENCGLLNAFALLEAGRRFGRPQLIERARLFLQAAAHFSEEYGAGSEYFSVNYLPVTLMAAAAVAEFAADAECRRLGQTIADQLWYNLAAVWHPGLAWTAGPSGRSYSQCSLGVIGGLYVLAWVGFGDAACPSPQQLDSYEHPERCGALPNAWPFNHAGHGWSAFAPFAVPAGAIRLCLEKTFPFDLQANTHLAAYRGYDRSAQPAAEVRRLGGWMNGPTGMVPNQTLHPRGHTHLFCHMQPTYGVGTATAQMTGQSDTCRVTWRLRQPVQKLGDRRMLYLRYTVNDALETCFNDPAGYGGLLAEQGRGGGAQSGPLAIQWYAAGDEITQGIAKLRTGLVVNEWFGKVEEVRLGETVVDSDAAGHGREWVFLRDGEVYVAIHPLVSAQYGGDLLGIHRFRRVLAVTFANYDGPPRSFLPAELRQTGGGAVVVAGAAAEFGDFAGFRRCCRQATIKDTVYESQRHIKIAWRDRQLELLWDLQTENLVWVRTERGFVKEERFRIAGQ